MGVVAVKPCCNSSVHLQFAETPFDQIALGVEFFVVSDPARSISLGWNDNLHPLGSDKLTNAVGVIAFVGNHRFGLVSFKQGLSTLAVGLFSSGE